MHSYIIDFTRLKSEADFFTLIKSALGLPDWCGENFSAIWDMLTGYMEPPTKITIIGGNTLPRSLEQNYTTLIKVIQRAHDLNLFPVDFEIIS